MSLARTAVKSRQGKWGLFAAQRQASWRVGLVLVLLLALGSAAWVWPSGFRVALAHAHNLVALALWVFGFARQPRTAKLLALGFLVVAALLLATPLAWFGFELGLRQCLGLSTFQAAATLAPGRCTTPTMSRSALGAPIFPRPIPRPATPRGAMPRDCGGGAFNAAAALIA